MGYAHDVVGDDRIYHRYDQLNTYDDLKLSFTEYSAMIALYKLDRNGMTGVLSTNIVHESGELRLSCSLYR